MKKLTIAAAAILSLTSLTGCVTRKIPVMPEAKPISAISELAALTMNCQIVDVYTIEDAHPNNVVPDLKNHTYLSGGNRYHITSVLDTRRGRPSSVVANIYHCATGETNSKPSGQIALLPGAHTVQPIAFSEIENNTCKVLTSYVVEKTQPKNLETELANETYMRGGNRFHITKIIATDGGQPSSVAADIYRCKHQTVHY